ncbi:Integrase, catalytic core,Ribonuclease H-like domain, partial [Cinara cedri]
VQTTNGLWRISIQCLKCKTNKSKFIIASLGKKTISKIKFEKITEQDELNITKELHKPVKSKFPKRKIKTYGINDLWVADLVIMRNYGDENSGYLCILNVINTFSKFAWSEFLKKKDGKNVTKGFEEIIKRAKLQKHNSPTLLHIDKGTEFVIKQFKEMLTKHNKKLYHTQNEEKSEVIERFNRILNGKMKIQFEVQKNKRWIDILQDLLNE